MFFFVNLREVTNASLFHAKLHNISDVSSSSSHASHSRMLLSRNLVSSAAASSAAASSAAASSGAASSSAPNYQTSVWATCHAFADAGAQMTRENAYSRIYSI